MIDEAPGAEPRTVEVDQGDLVIFASRERFRKSEEGEVEKVPLRHGMTLLTSGSRYGMGIVFHLAE